MDYTDNWFVNLYIANTMNGKKNTIHVIVALFKVKRKPQSLNSVDSLNYGKKVAIL